MNSFRFFQKVALILLLPLALPTLPARSSDDPREVRRTSPVFGVAKKIPINAVRPNYTPEMAESDRLLAEIFGASGAVAAANGFEPVGLASHYPIYRGDLRDAEGFTRRGHLSYAMHLYGSADGTATTAIYIPQGFVSHSKTPTPSDAAVTFFYPRLGTLRNITIAVFHIANFAITQENRRVRIGDIGGRGGSYQYYKHSHIEFYRGNVGLPSAKLRPALRIDPASVFRSNLENIAIQNSAVRKRASGNSLNY
jgi:hypothetical protein